MSDFEPGIKVDIPGRLGANLMYFARTLRAAGLPVGSGAVLDALRAVEAVGVARRDDFYWALHAVFVRRADHRPLFDEAFHVFWRNPKLLERVTSLLLPTVHVPPQGDARPLSRRLSEALFAGAEHEARTREAENEFELDATLTWSDREVLRSRDFEQMSTAELAAARAAIARLRLAIPAGPDPALPPPSARLADRHSNHPAQKPPPRLGSGGARTPAPAPEAGSHRGAVRHLGVDEPLLPECCCISRTRSPATGPGCSPSSSAPGSPTSPASCANRDVDAAIERASAEVADWDGGTRIGRCLAVFNREWSRRVCGQGATVLFITDGLDRDVGEGLEVQADRLRKSCRRLVWLNPLLRYEGFEPKAAGMRALLPHVDELRPVHNLDSLEDLCAALVGPPARPAGATGSGGLGSMAVGPLPGA